MLWVVVMMLMLGAGEQEPAATAPSSGGDVQQNAPRESGGVTLPQPLPEREGGKAQQTDIAASAKPVGGKARLKWSDFEVIAQRNMFVTRSARTERRETSSTPAPPPVAPPLPPTRPWAFAGSAISSADRVAFLMDGSTGEVIRVREGESIDAGRIVKIGPAELEIESDGTTTKLAMGESLKGTGGSPVSGTPTGSSKTTEPAKSGSSSSGGTLSIEERMRLRRLQELGK